MKTHALIAACLTAGVFLATAAKAAATTQVPFLENAGQIENPTVSFYVKLASGAMFVTDQGELVYSLSCPRAGEAQAGGEEGPARWAFRESFGPSLGVRPVGADPSEIQVSQFKGPRPEDWHSRLAAYGRIDLGEVHPGVRVELRTAGGNVEKLIHLAPGAEISALQVAVEGVPAMSLDDAGRLVMRTGLGEIVFTAPEAHQVIEGERRAVEAKYVLSEHGYGFALGDYRPDREVIIDPLLASTFLGGSNPTPPGNYDDDIVYAMAPVGGLLYVAGATQSPDFPVHLGYDESLSSNFPDCFVTLMTGDLSMVVASTFLGTPSSDRVADLFIDATGSVVITGQAGYGFPVTPGAYTYSGTTPAGGGFVSRLTPDLSALEASAVVTPGDYPRKLASGNGGIYFGGTTNNPDFPLTPGAYRTVCCPPGGFGIRPYEGFAGRISSDLSTMEALTYLGGNLVSGMAVAPDGTVFITDGFDNAITGYVARFDAGLTTRLGYLSYYPGSTSGSSRTYFNDVAVDNDTVVVVGQTYMNDLPATPGAFDTTCGTDGLCDGVGPLLVPRSDGFIARYSLDLQATLALTYLGGSYHESIRTLALEPGGDIVIAGETASVDFPTTANGADRGCGTDGLCNPTGTYGTPTTDAFIARLSGDLGQLEYGSYLGGQDEEMAFDVALDGAGNAFVGGQTRSFDFPTTAAAFDQSYNGGTSDAFIAKFRTSGPDDGIRKKRRLPPANPANGQPGGNP